MRRMKETDINKMAMILVLLLCLQMTLFTVASASSDGSDLAQYMTRYDYVLPQAIAERIQVNFIPQEADCGPVRVRFDEILYDGQWMYTAASVWPQNPDEVIIMPGDTQKEDLVTGCYDETTRNHNRSFEYVAKEDTKQLLCVYAYMKEFANIGEYFLDHAQKADDVSVLMSGAQLAGGSKTVEVTWLIQVYDVDVKTGKYNLLNDYLFPMTIQPLQPYIEREYRIINGECGLFDSVVLAYSPLNTYIFPKWKNKQDELDFAIALIDEGGTPVLQGVPLAADTYALDSLPDEMFLIVTNRQTNEIISRLALVQE